MTRDPIVIQMYSITLRKWVGGRGAYLSNTGSESVGLKAKGLHIHTVLQLIKLCPKEVLVKILLLSKYTAIEQLNGRNQVSHSWSGNVQIQGKG